MLLQKAQCITDGFVSVFHKVFWNLIVLATFFNVVCVHNSVSYYFFDVCNVSSRFSQLDGSEMCVDGVVCLAESFDDV